MSKKKAQAIYDYHAYRCDKNIHSIWSVKRLDKAIAIIKGEQK